MHLLTVTLMYTVFVCRNVGKKPHIVLVEKMWKDGSGTVVSLLSYSENVTNVVFAIICDKCKVPCAI